MPLECVDQLETCPEIAPKNKCMTLAMICCETCEKYLANRTAIIEEALGEQETSMIVKKIIFDDS